jgi:hypothetical protein
MNATKLVSAIASIVILGSTIAIFRSSAPAVYVAAHADSGSLFEGRPVTLLEPVVVYADMAARDTVKTLDATTAHVRTEYSALDVNHFHLGSQLRMPYYSFGTKLSTLIKE